eukprot:1357816-Amorphochlora_amoeboformis.AAC.1
MPDGKRGLGGSWELGRQIGKQAMQSPDFVFKPRSCQLPSGRTGRKWQAKPDKHASEGQGFYLTDRTRIVGLCGSNTPLVDAISAQGQNPKRRTRVRVDTCTIVRRIPEPSFWWRVLLACLHKPVFWPRRAGICTGLEGSRCAAGSLQGLACMGRLKQPTYTISYPLDFHKMF